LNDFGDNGVFADLGSISASMFENDSDHTATVKEVLFE